MSKTSQVWNSKTAGQLQWEPLKVWPRASTRLIHHQRGEILREVLLLKRCFLLYFPKYTIKHSCVRSQEQLEAAKRIPRSTLSPVWPQVTCPQSQSQSQISASWVPQAASRAMGTLYTLPPQPMQLILLPIGCFAVWVFYWIQPEGALKHPEVF